MNDYNGIVIQRDSYGRYNVFIRVCATVLRFLYTSPDIEQSIITLCSTTGLKQSEIINVYPEYNNDITIAIISVLQ